MYAGIKTRIGHLTAEYDSIEPGNYNIGFLASYHTDAKHPNYIEADTDAPPVKSFKIRVDLFNRLMEVRFSNARRTRAR
jgi:hypothetical protein